MTELQALQLHKDLEERRKVIWNKSMIPDVDAHSNEWVRGVNEGGDVYILSFTLINPYSIMVHAIEEKNGIIEDEDIDFRCLVSDTFADVIIKLINEEDLICNNLQGYYLSSSALFSYNYTSKNTQEKTLTLKMDNDSITLEDSEVTRLARVLDNLKGLNWTLKDVTLVKDPFATISLKYIDVNDIKLAWECPNDGITLTFNNDEDFQGLILHMRTVIALGRNLRRYRVSLGNLTLGCNSGGTLTFEGDEGSNIITWVLEVDDHIFIYKSTWNEFNIIVERMDKFFQEVFIQCNQTL